MSSRTYETECARLDVPIDPARIRFESVRAIAKFGKIVTIVPFASGVSTLIHLRRQRRAECRSTPSMRSLSSLFQPTSGRER
jgi:hypothetical protein